MDKYTHSTTEGPTVSRLTLCWHWGIVLGYAACIFVLSATPGHDLPEVHVSDKLMHMGEYGVLGVFLYNALRLQAPTWSQTRLLYVSVLLASAYGATDEFHQLFVAGRTAAFDDLMADSLGAGLAVWLWQRTRGVMAGRTLR